MHGNLYRPVHPKAALVAAAALLTAAAVSGSPVFYPKLSEESAACTECHTQQTPAIV